ncbi:MAG: protein translocase subunit SecD [Lachnospiraceae bacterium]|nr:protein translocase subunit SecD [Lachnospiraceae bacterium]
MKKSKGVAILLAMILILAGLAYYASLILSSAPGAAEDMNIKLGLDLAGGVSITYKVETENPTSEQMKDTIYKLQKRVEGYSTEVSVYQEGDDRITVEIPGVKDANAILEELGKPGSLEFRDPTGNVYMTGLEVQSAEAAVVQDEFQNKQNVVKLTLTEEGAQIFAEITAANIGKNCPIVYDGEVISNPTVKSAINGGEAIIEGMSSYEEAENLASSIRIGALSLELSELQSQVVGAQLGTNAIASALKAAAIGLALIAVFMIAYYWIPGVAATIALAIYTTLVIAVIYLFEITLTLPGIAGIILSIGMAVDANVIIFARIREEIAAGSSVHIAIKTGFKKALSAIIDGNITTLIAAIVLGFMGSGTVKGFAYTLAVGIILSMFTALAVTRVILHGLYCLGFRDEKFYGRQKELKSIGFMAKKPVFFIISLVVIVAGFVGMGVNHANGNGALNLSLEFVGGTATTVDMGKDYTLAEIDDEVVPYFEEITGDSNVQVQKVEGSNQVVFKTRVLELEERENLNKSLEENLGIDTSTLSSNNISSTISGEMTKDAVIAVIISTICMLIYIWFRFSDLRFASTAILALVHDVLVILTCYALFRLTVGSTFIAVMLTIIGYSINATIVIFDRVRENLKNVKRLDKATLQDVSDKSVTQTLSRSLNTSLTTFVMVLLLYILGVASIRDFALPLMVGIVSGTYSSICIATELWFVSKTRLGKGRVE